MLETQVAGICFCQKTALAIAYRKSKAGTKTMTATQPSEPSQASKIMAAGWIYSDCSECSDHRRMEVQGADEGSPWTYELGGSVNEQSDCKSRERLQWGWRSDRQAPWQACDSNPKGVKFFAKPYKTSINSEVLKRLGMRACGVRKTNTYFPVFFADREERSQQGTDPVRSTPCFIYKTGEKIFSTKTFPNTTKSSSENLSGSVNI